MVARQAYLFENLTSVYRFTLRYAAFLFFSIVISSNVALANDIRISNTRLENQDTTQGVVQVAFDLAWNNSWRLPPALPPANWDAAWVFVKFRVGFVNPLLVWHRQAQELPHLR